MPNKNYEKGRRKEYRIMNDLRRLGYEVLRMAGSHGFADIIAIDNEERKIRFIQCKPDGFPLSEMAKLLKKNNWINGSYECSFEVI